MVSSTSITRIAIVDDHEIIALAVTAILADVPDLVVSATAMTVGELLEGLPDLNADDLVILDLRLADGSSPTRNVARLRATGAKVMAFTSGENPHLVRTVARTDVLGVLRKSTPADVLVAALRTAAQDAPVVSTDWAAALDSDPQLADAGLSAQEQRVLALFASGNKAQTVATQAGIALSTVDDYVRRIRSKYARIGRPAHTKVDLYKRAIEDGFLPLPGQGE